jgi:tetratricopeptide (TPR) repeat protein
MRQNSIGTCESRSRAQIDQARLRWIEVHEGLSKITSAEVPYIDVLRNAIAFAIGSLEARMGLTSATRWADLLDKDAMQQVNALYLRKIISLQVGDAEGAERYHRQAEVLALQARVRQMFTTTLPTELAAHALAGDLSGVKQVGARIQPLADAYPGWRAHAVLAEAQFQQLRGDLEAALTAFERCIAMASPDVTAGPRMVVAWPPAIAGYLETLIGLERHEEARRCGEQALATCKRLEIGVMSHEISRSLALAEAKLGEYAKAVARLDTVIAEQKAIGTTGLILGASYEARARIAIWASDEAALTEYANLTAKEYRHGRRSPLGARWERLMAEARRAAKRTLPRLAEFESSRLLTGGGASVVEMATDSLGDACTAEDRAQRTLKLLCDDRTAIGGYLYLVGDSGLTLVASERSPEPPDGLLEYLQEYFEREVSEDGDHTAALTGPEMAAALGARPSFRDGVGIDHHPVLMTSVADGVARHAGVAVFVEDARAKRPLGGAGLVAALSAHLIHSGDTRGVAA